MRLVEDPRGACAGGSRVLPHRVRDSDDGRLDIDLVRVRPLPSGRRACTRDVDPGCGGAVEGRPEELPSGRGIRRLRRQETFLRQAGGGGAETHAPLPRGAEDVEGVEADRQADQASRFAREGDGPGGVRPGRALPRTHDGGRGARSGLRREGEELPGGEGQSNAGREGRRAGAVRGRRGGRAFLGRQGRP